MAEPVVCPSCQKSFTPAGEFRLAWLTCPFCRAMVANPATEPSPPADTPVARPAAPVPDFRMQASGLCPGCGKTTQSQWLFCAYCEHPLRSPFGGRSDAVPGRESEVAANRKGMTGASRGLGARSQVRPSAAQRS